MAEIGGLSVPVRIIEKPTLGGWVARSMRTGRPIRIRNAGRLQPAEHRAWRYRAVGRRSGQLAEGLAIGCEKEVQAVHYALVELRAATKKRRCKSGEVIDLEFKHASGKTDWLFMRANQSGVA